MSELAVAEELLLARHRATPLEEARAVFILGAPRTGSTLLFQLLAHCYHTAPLTNLVNDAFAAHPSLGVALSEQLRDSAAIEFTSSYGKTRGPLGPSEGSAVFCRWFGSGEPSALHSVVPLPGMEAHIQDTVRAVWGSLARPFLTKNAWNCFRVAELARILPASTFIWIRRDVVSAAVSDLESRYRRGGPDTWNSATPANYQEIIARPYWEQVVEQQAAFSTAIESDLKALDGARSLELWYEDLCDEQDVYIERIRQQAGLERNENPIPEIERSAGPALPDGDRARIERYVDGERRASLSHLCYRSGARS